MDIIIAESGGQNIVIWPMALNPPLPDATAAPVLVIVYMKLLSESVSAFREAARGVPGSLLSWRHMPDVDEYVHLCTRTFSASGTPDYATPAEAFYWNGQTVLFKRETEAPLIGQNAPATADEVEIGITGFTRFARFRRVTISANADMSDPLAVLLYDSANYAARELPRYLTLTRRIGVLTTEGGSELQTEDGSQLVIEDDATILPLTVYVTVAHSGGAAWTPESNILEATFAAVDGTGGSTGDFDPIPRDRENLGLIV
jgi:hypothetical protein